MKQNPSDDAQDIT